MVILNVVICALHKPRPLCSSTQDVALGSFCLFVVVFLLVSLHLVHAFREMCTQNWAQPSSSHMSNAEQRQDYLTRRTILFVKPRGVLILSNGTTLLIHARFLIHNHHELLWAELLLAWLFFLVTGRCSACLVLLPVVSWV